MAIYHLEAKVISRGAGRSAVAAAAYMSCSRITNDYDGVTHDYTRKHGLIWEKIFLPKQAPGEWADRSALWNAVEAAEKTKDSRLAREVIAALPVETTSDVWQEILTDFIKRNFVNRDMCAHVCVHDTDGHNPHAHIIDDEGYLVTKIDRLSEFVFTYQPDCAVHWVLIAILALFVVTFVIFTLVMKKKLLVFIASGVCGAVTIVLAFFAGCVICTVFTVINLVVIAAGALLTALRKSASDDDDKNNDKAETEQKE